MTGRGQWSNIDIRRLDTLQTTELVRTEYSVAWYKVNLSIGIVTDSHIKQFYYNTIGPSFAFNVAIDNSKITTMTTTELKISQNSTNNHLEMVQYYNTQYF